MERLRLKENKPKAQQKWSMLNQHVSKKSDKKTSCFSYLSVSSKNKFYYISYHCALWASSNYNNQPEHSEKTKTSICGVIQGPLLQALSIVFPYQMQNVPEQRWVEKWQLLFCLRLHLFMISHLYTWSCCKKSRVWVITHKAALFLHWWKKWWLTIALYMCKLHPSSVTKEHSIN